MKHVKLLFVLMTILFLAFPQHGFAKDTKNVGKIADISGTVELKKSGGKKQFKAVRNMSITQGDSISTAAKSKAVLHIDGDKEVTIAANTKVVIKQLVKSIKADQGKTQLSLVGGKVTVKINKKLQGDSKFQVQTPNAIMGVMGTEFDVAYGNGQTTIAVREGVVRVTPTAAPDGTTPEEQYDVYPQQMMQVGGDGSTPPREMTDADRAFFDSESDLSQSPADEQNTGSSQSIQYGPVANVDDDDDDDRSSGGGSSGGSSNSGGTSPTPPDDSSNTPAPGDTDDSSNTTNPDDPTDPGQTTDPNDPADPGQTTDPNDPADPGQTTDPTDPADPGTSTPPLSQYDEGFNAGVADKTAQLLEELYNLGFSIGEEQANSNPTEASERYGQGYSDGQSTLPNPTPDLTTFYEDGFAIGRTEGYNEGYLTTTGTPPVRTPLTDYEQGYQDGFNSIEMDSFELTAEALDKKAQGESDATALWATLSNDAAYQLGFERGQAESLAMLQYEQYEQGRSEGYEQGYNEGTEDGLNGAP